MAALDTSTGKEAWHRDLPRIRPSSSRSRLTTREGGCALIAPRGARVFHLRPTDGAILAHAALSRHAVAAVAGSQLVIGAPREDLVARKP